jgi:hypothetical protein
MPRSLEVTRFEVKREPWGGQDARKRSEGDLLLLFNSFSKVKTLADLMELAFVIPEFLR